ncbi:M42 family metallopeptidase [Alkalihalobacillus sp. LMS39]|uniref:M42 family metallopeptidase n=1 Tax=Alkalihalobacillus sp. LMS39 TaxID=2924032 RepID=UPI001FB4E265|nr:M42 family metallopeptidase [Alkalihalobacillus sp. LMS39]UOE95367.1 M42 family metallopeptidase [Alkalihalobacillus sp. LMS39]
MFGLLKDLTSLHGPCGYEQPVSKWIRDKVKDKVEHVQVDSLGNVIAKKKGKKSGPTVIVTAHMDEIGFIVKKIENNGLLRFEKLGGHDDRILLAQKVQVRTSSELLTGVIGTMSAHYAKFDDASKVRNHRQLYIDIGATSKEHAIELGIEIGNPITWAPSIDYLGNSSTGRFVGKGFDDRAGCAIILSLLENLQDGDFCGELIAIFTVQEEVGLRGAQVATNGIEADVAIAIDTTAVSDTPEETMDQTLGLGEGTGIKVIDFSLIAHPTVKEKLVNLAKIHKIRYQQEVFPGIGTDGGAVSLANKGIATGVLSIPSRYAHSPVEVIDKNDLDATLQLLETFIRVLDENSSFNFI